MSALVVAVLVALLALAKRLPLVHVQGTTLVGWRREDAVMPGRRKEAKTRTLRSCARR